ncbi:Hypothetical predicted protein [Olea europaea subsp. europaea]|uniref:Uncharacterized protein n=1 Tax=Olea europaea subsp. europaea TaxID=158383 RepID=A0A8S0VFP8_OLEEU|nr:Hypothetical predicted protein [Olea europaea subsp. europaea]
MGIGTYFLRTCRSVCVIPLPRGPPVDKEKQPIAYCHGHVKQQRGKYNLFRGYRRGRKGSSKEALSSYWSLVEAWATSFLFPRDRHVSQLTITRSFETSLKIEAVGDNSSGETRFWTALDSSSAMGWDKFLWSQLARINTVMFPHSEHHYVRKLLHQHDIIPAKCVRPKAMIPGQP